MTARRSNSLIGLLLADDDYITVLTKPTLHLFAGYVYHPTTVIFRGV
jgi:hypothetical protein